MSDLFLQNWWAGGAHEFGTAGSLQLFLGVVVVLLLLLLVLLLVLLVLLVLHVLLLHVGLLLGHEVGVQAKVLLEHLGQEVGEHLRLLQVKAGAQGRGVIQHVGNVQGHGILLIVSNAVLELLNDGVLEVDLQHLLGLVHVGHGLVSQGLRLHEALHVGGPAEAGGHEGAGRLGETVGHNGLLDGAELLDHPLREGLELLLGFLHLVLVRSAELQALLGHVHHAPLVVILVEVLQAVLVDGVDHVQHLIAALEELLHERGLLGSVQRLRGVVVDVTLALLHAADVVLKGRELAGLGRLEFQQLGHAGAVVLVLDDAQLDVRAVLLPERVELLGLVLRQGLKHRDDLAHNLLVHDADHLVLLQDLTGHVQGQGVGVDHTLDERQPARDDLLEVVRDEHAADVQLHVNGGLAVGVKHAGGRLGGDEQEALELDVALSAEVHVGQGVLVLLGERAVELVVLLVRDLASLAGPDGLVVVEQDPVPHLHPLGLLLLVLLGILGLLLGTLLNILGILGLGLGLSLLHRLLNLVADPQVDGEVDELGVLGDQLLQHVLLHVLQRVLLEVQGDTGTAAKGVALRVLAKGELAAGVTLPHVLHGVVVALGDDGDLVGDKEGRVETNTELADEGHVAAARHLLEEGLGTRLGDRTEVGNELVLGHANTAVGDVEDLVLLVHLDTDVQLSVVTLAKGGGV
mmetsp:Transcript_34023/g.85415  ORF Transcript_34023/g.85415 Transcript_34023/m.85415 type:complete len:689 (+) Transcript_34023:113-2179(+)